MEASWLQHEQGRLSGSFSSNSGWQQLVEVSQRKFRREGSAATGLLCLWPKAPQAPNCPHKYFEILGLGFRGLGNNQLKQKLMWFASLDVGFLSENQRILEEGSEFWDSVMDWGWIESLRFELGLIRKIRVGELASKVLASGQGWCWSARGGD